MRGSLPMPDTPITDGAVQAAPHVASLGALGAAIMGYLPGVIALVPAIYYLLLIYEGKTVQRWLARRRAKRIARRIHAKKNKKKDWSRAYFWLLLVMFVVATLVGTGLVSRVWLDSL